MNIKKQLEDIRYRHEVQKAVYPHGILAVFNKDAKDDDVKWITVNGAHIPLNEEGTAVGGALKGENFSNAKSTSKTSTASSGTSQSKTDWKTEEAIELAESMRSKDYWDDDECKKLVELADMMEEWETADDDFETILHKAAKKLGVEIL